MIRDITPPLPPRTFHDRIYGGDILCFRALPAMVDLVAATRAHIEAVLAPIDPIAVHQSLSKTEQIERLSALQRWFTRDPAIESHWARLFEALGLAADGLARDRLTLRVQTHDPAPDQTKNDSAYRKNPVTAPLAFHRDTWGSNLYAQVNWWAPLYPLTVGRTMVLYPRLWDRPLRNSSPDFDLPSVVARNRARTKAAIDVDEVIPQQREGIGLETGQPVVIEPGDLLAFSGAQAHASVPNRTGLTRFSLETRSLWVEDVRQGRGAPNIDGAAPWQAPGWFTRRSDGEKLSAILGVAPICPYDPPAAALAGATGGAAVKGRARN